MKVVVALLMLALPFVVQAQPVGLHTPGPRYPDRARADNLTGSGRCRVVFDAAGHVKKATMSKSTGSEILDQNTVSFAREHWTGPPNTLVTIPIVYRLDGPELRTPRPPYPFVARAAHLMGAGICQVVFDASGHASKVTMIKSTGSDLLDGNTVNYARQSWTGRPNTVLSVPIRYVLH